MLYDIIMAQKPSNIICFEINNIYHGMLFEKSQTFRNLIKYYLHNTTGYFSNNEEIHNKFYGKAYLVRKKELSLYPSKIKVLVPNFNRDKKLVEKKTENRECKIILDSHRFKRII